MKPEEFDHRLNQKLDELHPVFEEKTGIAFMQNTSPSQLEWKLSPQIENTSCFYCCSCFQ